MDKKKTDILWLWISIAAYLLMSMMFLLMPLGSSDPFTKNKGLTMTVGACFWICLIAGAAAQCVLASRINARVRIERSAAERSGRRRHTRRRIGLLTFCSNKYAVIADIAAVLSLAGLVVSAAVTGASGYICYIFLAVFSFAFCLHCILNGRIYQYVATGGENQTRSERYSNNEHDPAEGEEQ